MEKEVIFNYKHLKMLISLKTCDFINVKVLTD